MVKTTGKEFKEFYGDDSYWQPHIWVDDIEVTANDVPFDVDARDVGDIDDKAVVRIHQGVVFFDQEAEKFQTLEKFFKGWRSKQNSQTFVISVPNEDIGIFKQVVKNHKWKLV